MKRFSDFLSYMAYFLAVDVSVFFGIYFLHAVQSKGFGPSAAATTGLYEVIWRLVSLQLIIQILLMLVLFYLGAHRRIVFVLIAALIAFSISSILSFSDPSSILKLLYPGNREGIGEGFAIILSALCAWASIELLGKQA